MKNSYEVHRLSLRHYIENRGRPIFNLLVKNRTFSRFPLQFIKTCFFQTTLAKDSLVLPGCVQSDRIGIAVTYNQFAALAESCDMVICLDRRGYDAELGAEKRIAFYLAPTPQYLVAFVKSIFQCLFTDASLLRYVDIIARQKCLDCKRLAELFLQTRKPVYVSNLNNPLILYIRGMLDGQVTWAHLPHAALGNTIFPDLSSVGLYIAYDNSEKEKLKKSGWKTRIYARNKRPSQPFKPSKAGHYFILLPKNYWDVDTAYFSQLNNASIVVRFHPSTLLPMRSVWRIWFLIKTGKRVLETRAFKTDGRVFSASTSVVFSALNEGKCVFKLPLRTQSLDHYGFDSKLLGFDHPETEAIYEQQKSEILLDV